MKSWFKIFLFLAFFCWLNNLKAQYGYSEFVESLMGQVTDSSLSLVDRQLSGDTSVLIGGVLDTIKTRNSYQPGNARAAQLILEKFLSYGLAAEYQQYDPNGYNVVATKTGAVYPNEQYIICAHYDDMPSGAIAPGADDNASGTSAVLEAARVLSPYTFDYTLKFIAFDEEEQGMIGSRAYADTAFKYGVVIKGVINLDMIGWDSNDDYEVSISSNTASMPLLVSFIDILRIFQPIISPHLIIATNSDHSSFWNKGYQALLAIEENPGDFLPVYHTVNDIFDSINRPYFLAITRGAIASFATMGRNYQMNMAHQPVNSDRFTGDRILNLVVTSPHLIDTVNYKPRLYYKVDEDDLNFLTPSQIAGDTFKFIIPGQMPGSKISYYFAAQDSDGEFSVTLPESGKGINPPGLVSPPVFFSYYILNDTTATICATGLPISIPGNQTIYKSISVPYSGQLLDINVKLSISHTYVKHINVYLVSASGREVMLSNKNGITMDHYTNTIFDDEATNFINQGMPPYTGTYRPEQPLALFDDTATNGTWSLKIVNAGGTTGSLTSFCLILTFAENDYYVDAARPVSGNGRSWATAFRTISEAVSLESPPGSMVLIKPGVYNEHINITSNGQEIVPLKTGVTISNLNKIEFPAGTNLSGIDLFNHPGEYYAYVFRSTSYNNGFFQVKQVNDASDFILVETRDFLDEAGMAGDSSRLSACVIQPVIYQKYTSDPVNERVIADAASDPEISTVLYIGDPIGDGSYDALPASYNIIDGIDLTGSVNGGGIHLQSSSFNIICNSRIFELNGAGIRVNGNEDHPAYYNLIMSNEVFNTPYEGIFIGAGGMPEFNNYTHYTHLLGNTVHTIGNGYYAQLENAIDINDDNVGTLIERNLIHDFNLVSSDKGAVDINSGSDETVLNGNIFKNIGHSGDGTYAVIMVHGQINSLDIFNNIIDNYNFTNNVYAFRIDATGHENSRVVHNTVYNTDKGFLLEDYGEAPDFGIYNNIIYINDQYFTHLGSAGRLQLSHNYYNDDPTPESWMPYFAESGRQVGEVSFRNPTSGDFRLVIGDYFLICNGLNLDSPVIYDFDKNLRDNFQPDIGAYELENKIIWTGLVNQNWSVAGNWNSNSLPTVISNTVIQPALFNPVIDIDADIRGLLLKPGSILTIPEGKVLQQNQAY